MERAYGDMTMKIPYISSVGREREYIQHGWREMNDSMGLFKSAVKTKRLWQEFRVRQTQRRRGEERAKGHDDLTARGEHVGCVAHGRDDRGMA